MIPAFYINVKYFADAIHSDRLRRQPGRRYGLSRHRLGPRNMPLEAKAGERNPVTGTRESAAASSWELGISAQRAARRTLWLVSSACRRCDDTEGANNAGLTEINQASTWFTGLKVETHSELRKPVSG